MVSNAHPTYQTQIVRLIHGDTNPLGPGFIEREVKASPNGEYAGHVQLIHTGSFITVPNQPVLEPTCGFTIQAWIYPTTPSQGIQGLIGTISPDSASGYQLFIERAELSLSLAGSNAELMTIRSGAALRAGTGTSSLRSSTVSKRPSGSFSGQFLTGRWTNRTKM
jgi:hypothetical protein